MLHEIAVFVLQGSAVYFATCALGATIEWLESKLSREDKETDFTLSD